MRDAPQGIDNDPETSPEAVIASFGRDLVRDFDINAPVFNDRFDDALNFMVRKCPVVRSQVGSGYHVINTQDDVRAAAQDWQTFSSAKGFIPNRPDGVPYMLPEECDPPLHTRWRHKLNPHFSPRTVAAYAPAVREDVNALINRFIDKGECEFISEFGTLLPGWAFFKNVLGLPVDDLSMLVNGVEEGMFHPDPDERARHIAQVFDYLENHLKWRQGQPARGDLIDTILAGVTYDDGTQSPWEDKLSVLYDLTQGGIATTTFVMGSAIHHLAAMPDQRQLLLDDPALIESAIEEYARFFPPVVALGRTATRDVEVSGTLIREGDFVMLAYASASRDPRHMEEPEKIDIRRQGIPHSTFGLGPHRCIGSNLARMELAVTLEEWLKRIPHFRVKPGTAPTHVTSVLRSMRTLHLEW